ncbi:DUF2849 domain-containing protein [Aureimonas frigidaquae]|uniref:DUF2849 domain-containing protein n=1 Tax=Aureimonas frigidaquae TaxID=424757 RepID=A0A0P0Z037_9HYPH|nr:DUF2849 domain-containing protein [Aureimonas frigidaquae]BAT27230.1 hypothetical protein [Aureimonas frigidaquae]
MADVKKDGKYKGIALPVILSANDLLDGAVVFLTQAGWTFDPAKALVGEDADAAEAMEARGLAAAAANLVVDPYLVAVRLDEAGFPRATHFREAIRQAGPSTHPELGKQAEFRSQVRG